MYGDAAVALWSTRSNPMLQVVTGCEAARVNEEHNGNSCHCSSHHAISMLNLIGYQYLTEAVLSLRSLSLHRLRLGFHYLLLGRGGRSLICCFEALGSPIMCRLCVDVIRSIEKAYREAMGFINIKSVLARRYGAYHDRTREAQPFALH